LGKFGVWAFAVKPRFQNRDACAGERCVSRAICRVHRRTFGKRLRQKQRTVYCLYFLENNRVVNNVVDRIKRRIARRNLTIKVNPAAELFRSQTAVNIPFLIPDGFVRPHGNFSDQSQKL
jgi:hypothetical protein